MAGGRLAEDGCGLWGFVFRRGAEIVRALPAWRCGLPGIRLGCGVPWGCVDDFASGVLVEEVCGARCEEDVAVGLCYGSDGEEVAGDVRVNDGWNLKRVSLIRRYRCHPGVSALHDLVNGCFWFVAGLPWLVYGGWVCDIGGVCARVGDLRTVVVEGGLA